MTIKNTVLAIFAFCLAACGSYDDASDEMFEGDAAAELGEAEQAIVSPVAPAPNAVIQAWRSQDGFACTTGQSTTTTCYVVRSKEITYCVDSFVTADADLAAAISSARTTFNATLNPHGWNFTAVSCSDSPLYKVSNSFVTGNPASNNVLDYLRFIPSSEPVMTESNSIAGTFRRIDGASNLFIIDGQSIRNKGANLSEDIGYMRHVVRNMFLKWVGVGSQGSQTGFYSTNTMGFNTKSLMTGGETCRVQNYDDENLNLFGTTTIHQCAN